MIERFYARKLVGFETVDLTFGAGLTAVTGPSGAGKSVLMGALLALFGWGDMRAEVCEAVLRGEALKVPESCDTGEEEVTVRAVKREKIRYFLNDLTISKKRLAEGLAPFVRHIAQRDNHELSPASLLALIDAMAGSKEAGYRARLEDFRARYREYEQKRARLQTLRDEERRVQELIEFTEFEIARIDEIAPKVGEDESLMVIKRQLSRKEKIAEKIAAASHIFEYEDTVFDALQTLEADATLFSEAMNQLRGEFERAETQLEELEEIDVEAVLDRIEALAGLKRRYGSIEAALAYREEKAEELARLRDIDHTLATLEEEVQRLELALQAAAKDLSAIRAVAAEAVAAFLNGYLSQLRMPQVRLSLRPKPLDRDGLDLVSLDLAGSSIETLSGGEFNRIRLALMLCRQELTGGGGVLLIDEIDANVSGDESIAIAKLLKKLSRGYQVIAISHQPHLSAAADHHLLVTKAGGRSVARLLTKEERIEEIARMIAGEKGGAQARTLAKNLLKEFA